MAYRPETNNYVFLNFSRDVLLLLLLLVLLMVGDLWC